eukprot:GGOE01004926.1.p1 GENE.GGOE01004926.1~~GGOE01004926.1.p1  ORF type:complete len:543 (-),score=60.99 GGOE01004926.1:54-1547(-)
MCTEMLVEGAQAPPTDDTARKVEAATDTKDLRQASGSRTAAKPPASSAKTSAHINIAFEDAAQQAPPQPQRRHRRDHHPCRGRRAQLAERAPPPSPPSGSEPRSASDEDNNNNRRGVKASQWAEPAHKRAALTSPAVAVTDARQICSEGQPVKTGASPPAPPGTLGAPSKALQKHPVPLPCSPTTAHHKPYGSRPWSAILAGTHAVEMTAAAKRPASASLHAGSSHHLRTIPLHQKAPFTLEVTMLSRLNRQVKAGNCPLVVPLLKLAEVAIVPSSAFQSMLHQDERAFEGLVSAVKDPQCIALLPMGGHTAGDPGSSISKENIAQRPCFPGGDGATELGVIGHCGDSSGRSCNCWLRPVEGFNEYEINIASMSGILQRRADADAQFQKFQRAVYEGATEGALLVDQASPTGRALPTASRLQKAELLAAHPTLKAIQRDRWTRPKCAPHRTVNPCPELVTSPLCLGKQREKNRLTQAMDWSRTKAEKCICDIDELLM